MTGLHAVSLDQNECIGCGVCAQICPEVFSLNADVVASKVASALGAGRLILLTDVDGVKGADGNLISSIKQMK